jgi:hypothetical protein
MCVCYILADVLSSQDFGAGLAFEAAQVPLPVQREQGLAVLDVPTAAGAV